MEIFQNQVWNQREKKQNKYSMLIYQFEISQELWFKNKLMM